MPLNIYDNSQDALVAIIAGTTATPAYTDGRTSNGNITIAYNTNLDEIVSSTVLGDEAVIISYDNAIFESYENTDDRRTIENYTIFMKTNAADPITKSYAIVDRLQAVSMFRQTNLGGTLRKIFVEGKQPIFDTGMSKYVTIDLTIK